MNRLRCTALSLLFAVSVRAGYAGASANILPPAPGKVRPVSVPSVPELKPGPGEEIILDIYEVRSGDWLTLIAEKEYGDPDLWGMIYRFNSYIKEPHWIFPGDKIILPRVTQRLPEARAAVEEPAVEAPEEEKQPARNYRNFLGPDDFKFDGVIAGFMSDRLLQSQGDYCFINIGSSAGISEGKILNVYERGRSVVDPDTGKLMGYIYSKIGELRVTGDISGDQSTARVVFSSRSLDVGSLLLIKR